MSSEENYLRMGNSIVGFSGKDVLEVGGCSTPQMVETFSPKSWTAIDINPKRFDGKDYVSKNVEFASHEMSATALKFEDNSFDRAFSVNCFEHIDDMETALSEIHRVLRPGGLLFTIFGPIWSAPVGHHTWIEHDGKFYHFGSNVFPDWHHLIKSREELKSYLLDQYNSEVSEHIVKYVYESNDINRLTDGDFEKLIKESPLSTRIKIWQRQGDSKTTKIKKQISTNYPTVINPKNTEMLLVMSKGKVSLGDISRAYHGLLKEAGRKISGKIMASHK